MKHNAIKMLGLMSGTSMDGLDLALCEFHTIDKNVTFKLLASQTIDYEPVWKERLQNVFDASAEQYFKLNSLYGEFIADSVNAFVKKHGQKPDYIASHGHTVFHRPELGFTTQIGCGATIAAQTGLSTICDFRSLDVALKGQGAPLVPIGDRDLFSKYDSCLNIGGIANVSFTQHGITQAFDICVANMALNHLTETIGKAYDENGEMASEGNCHSSLLQALLTLNTKQQSIGREWFGKHFLPALNSFAISVNDRLATCVEYIALKISEVLNSNQLNSVLITGGGAYNSFLKKRLQFHFKGNIETPSDEIIQFKEAIIFAYLGHLRVNEEINTLSSVTRAAKDSIGACVYLGNK